MPKLAGLSGNIQLLNFLLIAWRKDKGFNEAIHFKNTADFVQGQYRNQKRKLP